MAQNFTEVTCLSVNRSVLICVFCGIFLYHIKKKADNSDAVQVSDTTMLNYVPSRQHKKPFLCAKLTELDKRIRVGAVSYLNTRPLLYGLKRSGLMDKIDLVEEYPSRIATMLVNDEIDVGLVPVVVIPLLKEAHIITDYCIGADGEVASVAVFSEVPLEQVRTVLLDYQSRTSVSLAKLLLKEYWQFISITQLNESSIVRRQSSIVNRQSSIVN